MSSRRMSLIQALKEVRGRVLSGDKAQISGIFTFPIPDSAFSTSVDDSLFYIEKEKHGRITQQMFNTYFKKIGNGAQLDEFKKLFSFLNPDSLLRKDTLEYNDIVDTEACFMKYSIYVEKDSLVSIWYGKGSNSSYVPKDSAGHKTDSASVADDGDGDEGICEYIIYWDFVFDGKKLRLVRVGEAD